MFPRLMQLACQIKVNESRIVITTETAHCLQRRNVYHCASSAHTKAFSGDGEHPYRAKIVGVTVAADVVWLWCESEAG